MSVQHHVHSYLNPQQLAKVAQCSLYLSGVAELSAHHIVFKLPPRILSPLALRDYKQDRSWLRLYADISSRRLYLLSNISREVLALDPGAGHFITLAPMPQPRDSFTAVAFRGEIFVISSCPVTSSASGIPSAVGTVDK